MRAVTNAFSSLSGMSCSSITVGRLRISSAGIEAIVLNSAPFPPSVRLNILALRAASMSIVTFFSYPSALLTFSAWNSKSSKVMGLPLLSFETSHPHALYVSTRTCLTT